MRSNFERRIAQQLDELGVPYEYEAHTFDYYLKVYQATCDECGSKEVFKRHWYTPDFYLPDQNITLEVKGRMQSKDRKIALAMKEYHPLVDLRFIFGANNKLSKKSQTRYTDWCEEHGLLYAMKEVPEEWIRS